MCSCSNANIKGSVRAYMPGLDALGADHRAATHVFLQQMECFRGAATSVLSCCSAYVPEPRGILHEVSALVKEVSTTAVRLQLAVLAGGG